MFKQPAAAANGTRPIPLRLHRQDPFASPLPADVID